MVAGAGHHIKVWWPGTHAIPNLSLPLVFSPQIWAVRVKKTEYPTLGRLSITHTRRSHVTSHNTWRRHYSFSHVILLGVILGAFFSKVSPRYLRHFVQLLKPFECHIFIPTANRGFPGLVPRNRAGNPPAQLQGMQPGLEQRLEITDVTEFYQPNLCIAIICPEFFQRGEKRFDVNKATLW